MTSSDCGTILQNLNEIGELCVVQVMQRGIWWSDRCRSASFKAEQLQKRIRWQWGCSASHTPICFMSAEQTKGMHACKRTSYYLGLERLKKDGNKEVLKEGTGTENIVGPINSPAQWEMAFHNCLDSTFFMTNFDVASTLRWSVMALFFPSIPFERAQL